MSARLPMAPLLAAARCDGASDFARLLIVRGVYTDADFRNVRRQVARWIADGLAASAADRVAVGVGWLPDGVWGPNWDIEERSPRQNAEARRRRLRDIRQRRYPQRPDRPGDVALIDRVVRRERARVRAFVAEYFAANPDLARSAA